MSTIQIEIPADSSQWSQSDHNNAMAYVFGLLFPDGSQLSNIATQSHVAQEIAQAVDYGQTPIPTRSVQIASGDIYIPRLGKVGIFIVDTEGSVGSDDLNNIWPDSSSSFYDGDLIAIRQEQPSRQLNLSDIGNTKLNGGSFRLAGYNHFIVFRWSGVGNNWTELGRFPQNVYPLLNATDQLTIDASDTIQVNEDQNLVLVQGAISGEILATFEIDFPAATTAGNILALIIDTGTGPFVLSTYTSVGFPGFDVTNWRGQINTETATNGGYTATNTGATTIHVHAPAGSGLTPNAIWTGYITESIADGVGPAVARTFGVVAGTTQVDGVAGTPQSDTLAIVNGLGSGQKFLLKNTMAPGKTILISGAAFANTFSLAGGVTVEFYKNPLTSLIERIYGGAIAACLRFGAIDGMEATGTYNSIVVGATPSPGYIIDRLSGWWELQNGAEQGFIGSIALHCGYVPQSDITVKLNISGDGTAANDVYLHFGALFVEAGTIVNTGESYANQTPAGPHTVALTSTADSMQHYSFILDGSAIPAGIGEGDTLNFVLVREGTNLADTYGGVLQVYSIDFTFSTN